MSQGGSTAWTSKLGRGASGHGSRSPRLGSRRPGLGTRGPGLTILLVLVSASLGITPGVTLAQDDEGFRNLHVLPGDIPRSELFDIMLENSADLGLPRRANEGCLFCHAGSMDVPSSEWDWASDENPRKATARAMMAMVADINETYLAGIDRTTDQVVTCYTCHAGRTNPLPLEAVLERSYETGGVDALIERYRALRSRYYAADAYDFRTTTLIGVADRLFEAGAVEDAIRVHETNIEATEDAAAHQGLIRTRMLLALERDGVDAMLAAYHDLKSAHPAAAYSPSLISGISWGLFRSDRAEAALPLWELNFEEHPDSYTATEDLAWGSSATGDQERAIALARAWVERNPDHELGLRLLSDLGGR